MEFVQINDFGSLNQGLKTDKKKPQCILTVSESSPPNTRNQLLQFLNKGIRSLRITSFHLL